ncbi:MAG: hypothetical protein KC996_11945 [Phycisphaerales bacterium]|nr:hypothetical protein [Phycisphaerales bacterium]
MFRLFVMMWAAALCSFAAVAEPISYQGFLNDNGAPANGVYDIKFKLFDAELGGTQVGPNVDAVDYSIVDGVFRYDLDFGDVYMGQDLWLRVFVRPGDSTDSFTELLPRQHLTQVPKAAYATVAQTAMDSFWEDAGGGRITYGTGIDKVLINRTNTVAGFEYFGVHAGTTGFGGMVMSTEANGTPAYAYGVGNSLKAYHFFRQSDNAWLLWIGGTNVLDIDSIGNMSIVGGLEAGGPVNADAFVLNAPRTLTYSISGDTFRSGTSTPSIGGDASGGAYIAAPGNAWMLAPVHLPQGATITALHATYLDNATGNMVVTLESRQITGTLVVHGTVSSSGTSVSVLTMSTTTISDPIVDNTSRGYHIRVSSTSWPGNLLLRVFGVRVEYTVNEAQ